MRTRALLRQAVLYVAVIAATAIASGCMGLGDTSAADGTEALVVVLFDRSASASSKDVQARYLRDFERILGYFEEGAGGTLVMDAIDANSLTTSDPNEQTFPKRNFNTNPLEFKAKIRKLLEASRLYAKEIVERRSETKGTEILYSLNNASDYFAARADADRRYVVIFSDMIEESDRLLFTKDVLTAEGTDSFLAKERESGLLPALSDVEVYAAGAGVTADGTPSERAQVVKEFWLRYLRASGANLPPHRYRATLISFP